MPSPSDTPVSPRRPNETEHGYKMRVADTLKPSPLDAFTANPSPVTAIRLAISDHKGAGNGVDWPYLDQLRAAESQLENRAKLVRHVALMPELPADFSADNPEAVTAYVEAINVWHRHASKLALGIV